MCDSINYTYKCKNPCCVRFSLLFHFFFCSSQFLFNSINFSSNTYLFFLLIFDQFAIFKGYFSCMSANFFCIVVTLSYHFHCTWPDGLCLPRKIKMLSQMHKTRLEFSLKPCASDFELFFIHWIFRSGRWVKFATNQMSTRNPHTSIHTRSEVEKKRQDRERERQAERRSCDWNREFTAANDNDDNNNNNNSCRMCWTSERTLTRSME